MNKTGWILVVSSLLALGIGLFLYLPPSGSQTKLELKPFVADQELERAVITVNKKKVSLAMLLQEVKKKGGHLPGRFETAEQRQQVVDELIHFELIAQEARKLNYQNDPEVQLAYKKILVAKFKREQIQTKLSEIIITDSQIRDYYQKHIERYKEPAMFRIAMIFLRKPANQNKPDLNMLKQKAEQVRQMTLLQKTRDFGKLAAKYSDDLQSKYKGGALPWLSEKSKHFRLEPTIVRAAFKLRQKDEISPVIETGHGFYLLKLIDLRKEKIKPVAAVRLQIQSDLRASRRQKWLDIFYEQLKEKADIQLNEGLISENMIWQSQMTKLEELPTFPTN